MIDGLFAVMMGLKKRQEHGLGSYSAYVEALWEVLRKFGMPDHFVNMLVRLHAGAVINVKIGEEGTAVDSSIGVQQGTCGEQVLFLFITEAGGGVARDQAYPPHPRRWGDVRGGVQPQMRRDALRALRLALRGATVPYSPRRERRHGDGT